MAINSEKMSWKQNVGLTFPCLRLTVDTGLVVLFTRSNVGFVLHPGTTKHKIGYYSSAWGHADDTSLWEKCSVTLTSED